MGVVFSEPRCVFAEETVTCEETTEVGVFLAVERFEVGRGFGRRWDVAGWGEPIKRVALPRLGPFLEQDFVRTTIEVRQRSIVVSGNWAG